jgi:hypothetical protein
MRLKTASLLEDGRVLDCGRDNPCFLPLDASEPVAVKKGKQ